MSIISPISEPIAAPSPRRQLFSPLVSYLALVVLSVGLTIAGAIIVAIRLGALVSSLEDETATAVEVYGNPSVIVLGAALLGAGVIGLLLALAVGSLGIGTRAAAPLVAGEEFAVVEFDQPVEPVEPVDSAVPAESELPEQAPDAAERPDAVKAD